MLLWPVFSLALRSVVFPLSRIGREDNRPDDHNRGHRRNSSRLIRSIPLRAASHTAGLPPEEDNSLTAAPRRLLIQPQHIPRRIPKPRRNLRGICSDRLHNLSRVRHYILKRRRNVIHHDIHQQPYLSHRRPSKHPRPAHLPRRIVKRHIPIAPSSDVPSKHLPIRACNIPAWHLDIGNLSVCDCRMHSLLLHQPGIPDRSRGQSNP